MRAAQDRFDRGKYNEAIRYAEAAANADPRRWEAWRLDGDARLALGDREGALTVYAYSLFINPEQPDLRKQVGSVATSTRPPTPPGLDTRAMRPIATGVEFLGGSMTLASASFSFVLDPEWSAGFQVGGAPAGLVGVGVSAIHYWGEESSAPFALVGGAADYWSLNDHFVTVLTGVGYEWRWPGGLMIRLGVYGHLEVYGSSAFDVSGDDGNSWHSVGGIVWPGITVGFAR